MVTLQNYRFCLLAGLYAAGGSFFGKLPSLFKDKTQWSFSSSSEGTYSGFLFFQCMPFVLMIICNILNWRYYLKGLQMSEQTLTATVLTAASNYVASFLLGILVFKESLSIISILGCALIVSGLWFLCDDNPEDKLNLKNQ